MSEFFNIFSCGWGFEKLKLVIKTIIILRFPSMKQCIDTVAKEIVNSIYDKEISNSVYDREHHFVYYLNGYRIVGIVKCRLDSTGITAATTTIRILNIIDPQMKELQIKYGINEKIEIVNGRPTIYIKYVPPELRLNGTDGMVLGYESLFNFISDQPATTVIIDFPDRNETSIIQYLDFNVSIGVISGGAPGRYFIGYIEYNNIRYNIDVIDDDDTTIGDYVRYALNGNTLRVRMRHGQDLKSYENLFIWIGNQHVVKKIRTIRNASRMLDKYSDELKSAQRVISELKDQIAELSKRLSEYEISANNKQNAMTIYTDLITFAT